MSESPDKQSRNWLHLALPFLVLLFVLVGLGRSVLAPSGTGAGGVDLQALGQTPVLADGRVKPLDTVARTELMILSGKQKIATLDHEMEAIQWLADVLTRPAVADQYPVFRVDHEGVLEQVGLTRDEGAEKKRFSYEQLTRDGRRGAIARQAAAAMEIEADDRDAYTSAVVKLESRLQRYESLQLMMTLGLAPPDASAQSDVWMTGQQAAEFAAMQSPDSDLMFRAWQTVVFVRIKGLTPEANAQRIMADWVAGRVPYDIALPAVFYWYDTAGDAMWDRAVPEMARITGFSESEDWARRMRPYFGTFEADPTCYALMDASDPEQLAPGAREFAEALHGYREGDESGMLEALARREMVLSLRVPGVMNKPKIESWFNRFMPFLLAQVLNIAAFVLGFGLLFFGRAKPGTWGWSLWWSVMGLLAVALVVHTFGIGARVWLQGRPPVTNLYSSAVFIGWIAVIVCLVVEWFSRLGIAAVTGGLIGFITLIIAHHLQLAFEQDTMQPMQAVLDSNFWLATHVVIITVGYAATFVAGILALLYLVLGMATPTLDRPKARLITQMVYGTICFALLFSFVGTVLGGIWADQSWGRFWGWDPKENGAVLIVMMNALTLHAKWGRMVKERGLMVLAVAGNIVTAWSWFGTNLLGVGLHSYGFMEGAMMNLMLFCFVNLMVMAIALAVPTKYWWSFYKPAKRKLS